MMPGRRGRRLGAPAVTLLLLLAATSASADSPPARGADSSKTATPQDRPSSSTPEPSPTPATPPAAAKDAKPPLPKNFETLEARDAISLLGKKVRDVAGQDMGMIVDVLVDSGGRLRAAVIDFGGFLGVGSRKIAVDCRLLQIRPGDAGVSVVLTLTRADVQAAPEYKPSSSPGQPVVIVGPPPPATAAPNPG
jgi:hypothetical protein